MRHTLASPPRGGGPNCLMADLNEPKKETVRITLPPRPTHRPTVPVEKETARINLPTRPPGPPATTQPGNQGPPSASGPLRPPPPLSVAPKPLPPTGGAVPQRPPTPPMARPPALAAAPPGMVRPPSGPVPSGGLPPPGRPKTAPLPPMAVKGPPSPPGSELRPPASPLPNARPPLPSTPPAAKAPAPVAPSGFKVPSPPPTPAKRGFTGIENRGVSQSAPRKETARIADSPMKATVKLGQVQPTGMPFAPVARTLLPTVANQPPPGLVESVPTQLCWALLGISALTLLIQLWTYFS